MSRHVRSRTKLGGPHSTYNNILEIFKRLHVSLEIFDLAVRRVARKLLDDQLIHNYERTSKIVWSQIQIAAENEHFQDGV